MSKRPPKTSPPKKGPLRSLALLGGFLCLLGLWLTFGDQGFVHLYRMGNERQAYLKKIKRLAAENERLLEQIHRLRTDPEYVEDVARKELGLIKENEVIYRFKKGKNEEFFSAGGRSSESKGKSARHETEVH